MSMQRFADTFPLSLWRRECAGPRGLAAPSYGPRFGRGNSRIGPTYVGGTRLSGPPFNLRSSIPPHRARPACPSDPSLRRDVLVTSVLQHWIVHCLSAGTQVPRRKRG